MKKKYVPDLPGVMEAEKAFIGIVGAASAAPECYKQLGVALSHLAQARDEGADDDRLRARSRERLRAVETVRAHGPSGVPSVDAAFEDMELAAEEAGEAKRSRR